MIYKYIVTIGDSLTTGARDEFGLNYGFYLSEQLNQRTQTTWYCIQRAETRFTVEDIRRRIYDYCTTTSEASIAILLIGSNNAKGTGGLFSNIFKNSYQQIIDVCRMHGKLIIPCTIPQIVFGDMPEHFKQDVNSYIDKYNDTIRAIASSYSLALCDLNNYILPDHLIDGVHLNNSGNQLIAKKIADTILGESHGTIRSIIP